MDADRCRQILATCLPTPIVENVRYLAEGWDSTVFLVNGDLLFRFPKRTEVAVTLERELRLLPQLAPTLPVPIPSFLHVVRDCAAYPWTFAGYRRIDGVPADEVALGPAQLRRLAAEAGRFLRALNDFPVARAAACGVGPAHVAGGPEQLRAFATETRQGLASLLTPAEERRLAGWFAGAEAHGILDFRPALVHGDLGGEHLLVDPASGALQGVIDFGDTGTGDPASDIAGLLGVLGEAAIRAALIAYGRPDDDALLARAALYRAMIPLHEVLFGLHTGDDDHLERGLVALRTGLLAERPPSPAPPPLSRERGA